MFVLTVVSTAVARVTSLAEAVVAASSRVLRSADAVAARVSGVTVRLVYTFPTVTGASSHERGFKLFTPLAGHLVNVVAAAAKDIPVGIKQTEKVKY